MRLLHSSHVCSLLLPRFFHYMASPAAKGPPLFGACDGCRRLLSVGEGTGGSELGKKSSSPPRWHPSVLRP